MLKKLGNPGLAGKDFGCVYCISFNTFEYFYTSHKIRNMFQKVFYVETIFYAYIAIYNGVFYGYLCRICRQLSLRIL